MKKQREIDLVRLEEQTQQVLRLAAALALAYIEFMEMAWAEDEEACPVWRQCVGVSFRQGLNHVDVAVYESPDIRGGSFFGASEPIARKSTLKARAKIKDHPPTEGGV